MRLVLLGLCIFLVGCSEMPDYIKTQNTSHRRGTMVTTVYVKFVVWDVKQGKLINEKGHVQEINRRLTEQEQRQLAHYFYLK